MKNIRITQKERRFLIIWIGVCAFAWFVNYAQIRGYVGNQVYLFTIGWDSTDFWPFTNFTHNLELDNNIGPGFRLNDTGAFYGIFKSFNSPEFIVYSLLGVAIIFVPKIW